LSSISGSAWIERIRGEAKKMSMLGRRLPAAAIVAGRRCGDGSLLLPGRAQAQGGAKPLSGTTLNIACWSSPYAKLLTEYVPQFEEVTGAKVNYDTPSFPIYNQRVDVELSTGGSSYDVLNVTFI
jgi:multiple sugar transport system substrate-binding protein